MIRDTDGNQITYWPISGLVEGQNSEVLEFIVEASGTGRLSASFDTRGRVWAKRTTSGLYQNISASPIDLTGLIGDIHFNCYVEALSPIEGLQRVGLSVIAGTSSPAGWVI